MVRKHFLLLSLLLMRVQVAFAGGSQGSSPAPQHFFSAQLASANGALRAGMALGNQLSEKVLASLGIAPTSDVGQFFLQTQALWFFALVVCGVALYWTLRQGLIQHYAFSLSHRLVGLTSTRTKESETLKVESLFEKEGSEILDLFLNEAQLLQSKSTFNGEIIFIDQKDTTFENSKVCFSKPLQKWVLVRKEIQGASIISDLGRGTVLQGKFIDENLSAEQTYILVDERKWISTESSLRLVFSNHLTSERVAA